MLHVTHYILYYIIYKITTKWLTQKHLFADERRQVGQTSRCRHRRKMIRSTENSRLFRLQLLLHKDLGQKHNCPMPERISLMQTW